METEIVHIPTQDLFKRIIDTIKPLPYPIECSRDGYCYCLSLVFKIARSIDIFLDLQGQNYVLIHQHYLRYLDEKEFNEMVLECIDKMGLMEEEDDKLYQSKFKSLYN